MAKVTRIEITEQEARDILTTAIEGRGIQYWASDYGAIYIKRDPKTLDIVSANIDADNAKGERVLQLITTEVIKETVKNIVPEKAWTLIDDIVEGDVDADGANVIVQLACFGEVIYG